MMAMLRDIQAAGVGSHRCVEARVISSTEDIPTRCFNAYHAAFVNSSSNAETADAADATT